MRRALVIGGSLLALLLLLSLVMGRLESAANGLALMAFGLGGLVWNRFSYRQFRKYEASLRPAKKESQWYKTLWIRSGDVIGSVFAVAGIVFVIAGLFGFVPD